MPTVKSKMLGRHYDHEHLWFVTNQVHFDQLIQDGYERWILVANLWEFARIVLGPSESKSLLGDLVADMMLLVPWDMPHSVIRMHGHMRGRASITYRGWVRIEMLNARIKRSTQVEFGESIVLGENLFLDGGIQEFRLPFGRVLCIPNEGHHMRPYLTAEFELAAQCLRESDKRMAHRRAWQFGAQFDYRTWTVSLPDAIPNPI